MLKEIEEMIMEGKTERITFVPPKSLLVGQSFAVADVHNLAVDWYTRSGADFDNHLTTAADKLFEVGMHFQISGKRKDIYNFIRTYSIP